MVKIGKNVGWIKQRDEVLCEVTQRDYPELDFAKPDRARFRNSEGRPHNGNVDVVELGRQLDVLQSLGARDFCDRRANDLGLREKFGNHGVQISARYVVYEGAA